MACCRSLSTEADGYRVWSNVLVGCASAVLLSLLYGLMEKKGKQRKWTRCLPLPVTSLGGDDQESIIGSRYFPSLVGIECSQLYRA